MPRISLPPLAEARERGLASTIMADLGRGSHSALCLLLLKGFNTLLTAVSSFVLAYVLVRTLGLQSYAVLASLLAVAALIVQTDLGVSGLAFSLLRSHFLREVDRQAASRDDQDLVATIVATYVAVAIAAVAVLGIVIVAGILPVATYGIAYLLVFAGAVCALPRMPLRAAINARDGFIWTEAVDLGRRIAVLAATLAMLLGLSFASYGALNLLIWTISIAALVWLGRRHGYLLQSGALRRGRLLLRREVRGVGAAVLLSSSEFVISIFPYYLLSTTRNASAVVAFDMFYKVTRFAAMSYLIGAETVLPRQTRAVHNGDASRLVWVTGNGLMVGLAPMTFGIGAVSMFGEQIFGVILNHSGIVSPAIRAAICAMLVFMLIQTTCSIVLIGVGKLEALARRAMATLVGMVLISALMVAFQWSVDTFIIAYVAVYGAGALLYAECLYSLNKALWVARAGEVRT